MTQKITKKDQFVAIIDVLQSVSDQEGITELVDFCNHEIDLLEKKAAKAKEAAAKKKSESDELTEKVASLLTADFQTTADITAQLDDEDISTHKVSYRLTQLVKSGVAEDCLVNVAEEGQKARKVKAYALAGASVEK